MCINSDLAVLYYFMNIHYTVSEAQTRLLLEVLNSLRGKNSEEGYCTFPGAIQTNCINYKIEKGGVLERKLNSLT